jgi:hypothetical protein
MWLNPLQDAEYCVVPFSLDLFYPRFQDSEEILARPPHRRFRNILAVGQGVEYLIDIVFNAFIVFSALVISVNKRKSRP